MSGGIAAGLFHLNCRKIGQLLDEVIENCTNAFSGYRSRSIYLWALPIFVPRCHSHIQPLPALWVSWLHQRAALLIKPKCNLPLTPMRWRGLLSSSIMHYSCFLLISFSSSHFSNHSFCLLMNIFLPCSEREAKQKEKGRQKDGEASEWPGGASSVGNLWQGSLVFHHGLI